VSGSSHREADATAGSPLEVLFLLGAFRIRRLGMLVCVLRVLLSLGRVLLALGMVVLAVSVGGGTMRLCRGLVMFRSLIVCVFHVEFLILAETFRHPQGAASIVAE
jgi:hypothetical protein